MSLKTSVYTQKTEAPRGTAFCESDLTHQVTGQEQGDSWLVNNLVQVWNISQTPSPLASATCQWELNRWEGRINLNHFSRGNLTFLCGKNVWTCSWVFSGISQLLIHLTHFCHMRTSQLLSSWTFKDQFNQIDLCRIRNFDWLPQSLSSSLIGFSIWLQPLHTFLLWYHSRML